MSTTEVLNSPTLARYLVYFNGVLVPSISVSMTTGVFSPVTAQVVVPPTLDMIRFGAEDRVQAAVFYLDSWYNPEKPHWALLFEGYIGGFSYINHGGKLEIQFSIYSNLYILQQLYLYFLSGEAPDVTARARADKEFPEQIILKGKHPNQLFTTELSGKKEISRPYDLIENVLLAVLGEFRDKEFTPKVTDREVETEVERLNAVNTLNFENQVSRRAAFLGTRDGLDAGTATDQAKAELENFELEKAKAIATQLNISLEAEVSLASLQQQIFKKQALDSLRVRPRLTKSIAQTGFYARFMRLTRFLEHWVASPYFEGRPNTDDPVSGKMGGGVFPFLRSANAKKFFKALGQQIGVKFGPNGSVMGILSAVFSTLFYEIVEIAAPPVMTLDAFGLPNGSFEQYKTTSSDSTANYIGWSAALEKAKKRLSIGSFLTKPSLMFSLPPACNTIFPSMIRQWHFSEDYNSQITRLLYSKRSGGKLLDMGTKIPGYGYNSSRVGYPSNILRHAQDAADKPTNDQESLVFPEEFYKGPATSKQEVPPLFLDIEKVAADQRFSNKLYSSPQTKTQILDPLNAANSIEAAETAGKKGYSTFGLYTLLAQQEYFKQKYGATAGAAALVFNPYLVPGFPVIIYDNYNNGCHCIAYLNKVTHTLNQGTMMTNIEFSHIRPLVDVMDLLEAERSGLDMAPQEVIGETRDLMQTMESANLYYAQLFRQGEVNTKDTNNSSVARQLEDRKKSAEATLRNNQGVVTTLELLFNFYAPGTTDYLGFNTASLSESQKLEVNTLRSKYSALVEETNGLTREIALLTSQIAALGTNSSTTDFGLGAVFSTESARTSVSNFKRILGWYSGSDGVEPIILSPEDEEFARTYFGDDPTKLFIRGPRVRTKLVPLPGVPERLFASTNQALNYASRPVCSLEQYIDFYAVAGRGKANIDPVGRGRGIRLGRRDEDFIPTYYNVIRQFIGGPGIEPGSRMSDVAKDRLRSMEELETVAQQQNVQFSTINIREMSSADRAKIFQTTSPFRLTTLGEDGEEVVVAEIQPEQLATFLDLPDSRKDWQALLLDYLKNIIDPNPTGSADPKTKTMPGG